MGTLLLLVDEQFLFDEGEVYDILRNIPGVYELERRAFVGAVMECRYDLGDDKTIVRLPSHLRAISIDGTGEASMNIALEIQKRLRVPLIVVDEGYNFCFPLMTVHSVADFEDLIRKSWGRTP
jgi:hypothetical protein